MTTVTEQEEKQAIIETPEEQLKIPELLPVLPLRDIVIFPFMIVPLFVSRERSIRAVDQALAENRMILLAAQRDLEKEEPGPGDLYEVGTVAIIMRMLKLPDGRIRILVQGLARAKINYLEDIQSYLQARDRGVEGNRPRNEPGARGADPQRPRIDGKGRQPGQEHLARSDGDRREPRRCRRVWPISPRRTSNSKSKTRSPCSRSSTSPRACAASMSCSPKRSKS